MSEQEINNMKYKTFIEVTSALGRKYNFDSISNLYGNSFAKDSGDIINGCNPLKKPNLEQSVGSSFAGLLGGLNADTAAKNTETIKMASEFDDLLAEFNAQDK